MIRFGAVLLCALSLLIQATTATDFALVWDNALYGGIVANPGDTVTFTYGANSDLWIHPTGSCEQSGRIQLGGFGPGSASYNFTDSDLGSPVTFATSVEDNCANGQIITFTVVPTTEQPSTTPTSSPSTRPTIAPTIETPSPTGLPTRVPTTPFPTISPTGFPTIVGATKFELTWFVAAYGDVEAVPGDSVTFTYDEFSDVWIHPSGDCSLDGSIFVGPVGPASVTYRFTEEDAGKTITFTSSVSDNCAQGQIINFEVAGRPTTPTMATPAPSIAPQTAAPILAPVRPLPTAPPVVTPTNAPVAPAPVAPPVMAPVAPPVAGPPTATSAPVDSGTPPTVPSPPVDTPTPPVDTPTAPSPPVDTPTAPSPPVDGPTTTAPPVDGPTAPSPPVDSPTVTPGAPTTAPVVPLATTVSATDLSQTLLGMTACDTACQDAWIAQMFETTTEYFSASNPDITLLANTPKITNVDVPRRLRRLQDGESGVEITYDHTFEYISSSGAELEGNDLATQPLANDADRTQFLADLKGRGESFIDLTGVTATDVSTPPETPTSPPTRAPSVSTAGTGEEEPEDDDSLLSNTYVLIGIGAAVLVLLFICLMCCRKGRKKAPAKEKVASPKAAASPKSSNGARSVQEDSVSEAPTTREELIHVFAPPGKLGVVIDTPSDGASFVHAVKPTSIIADRIKVGDKLVAVDDEDVRKLSAINVSKLIGKKSSQPTRKLTVLRTISVESP
ncbi:unnamed protein product [Cylindrotheca closterium]|uniref:PDZ domain-containing protein n=1 Tax=Cylindrotheca closterium TaxID=2856 RepID=A0AAD2CVW8_9STRA|nr:unnamed protein product [Cylindrotheca closterium]